MSSFQIPPRSVTRPPLDNVSKKFRCGVQGCEKVYSRPEHLRRHASNHNGGAFICPECSTAFHRKDLLERHALRHKAKHDKAGDGLGELRTRKKLWVDEQGTLVQGRNKGRNLHRAERPVESQATVLSIVAPLDNTAVRQNGQYSILQHNFLELDEEGTLVERRTKIRRRRTVDAPTETQAASTPSTSPSSNTTAEQDADKRRIQDMPAKGSDKGRKRQRIEVGGLVENDNTAPSSSSPENVLGEQDEDNRELQHNYWDFVINTEPEVISATPHFTNGEQIAWAADPARFLCNASWGIQPFQSDFNPLQDPPFDNSFRPDTAMSFNQTYTTASYFSYLFENDTQRAADGTQLLFSDEGPVAGMNSNGYEPVTGVSSHIGDFGSMPLQNPDPIRYSQGAAFTPPNYASLHYDQAVPSPRAFGIQNYPTPSVVDVATIDKPSASLSYPTSIDISPLAPAPTSTLPPRATEIFPDAGILPPMELPSISANAERKISFIISKINPSMPDGSKIMADNPLLHSENLQAYSDLFFTRFNSSYPLIHQPTFESEDVHPFLLLAIILLGATYHGKEAHFIAVCIHDRMRPLIHSSKDFGPRPEFSMLQAILLVECFGKNRAGQKQHDMSHLYHGLLINLIRRSDCQSAYTPPFSKSVHDLEKHWRLSVEGEQKRRLALLCFMWDTQHAVLFSQSLCMNASELKLTLPWDIEVWEASTPGKWLEASRKATSPPQYLSILRMYTNPSATRPPQNLNALSRVLIFHGLMSISWDFHRRDQTTLSLAVNNSNPWQSRMSRCYSSWKDDFEIYTSSVLRCLHSAPQHYTKFLNFVIANMAAYHTAQMILDVDIVDLQIYAGARHIIGRIVNQVDRARSRTNIEKWMSQDGGHNAATAAWHAAKLLRTGIKKLEKFACDEFHYPWCLYLATLMCWTFHSTATNRHKSRLSSTLGPSGGSIAASPTPDPSTSVPSSPPLSVDGQPEVRQMFTHEVDDEQDLQATAEMKVFILKLTNVDPGSDGFVRVVWDLSAKNETRGLLRCMVKHLNTVRWAVVREGMILLRGLLE